MLLLDPIENFLIGLKLASVRSILFQVSQHAEGVTWDPISFTGGYWSSAATDKPWLKQLSEIAKSSFSKEGSGVMNDPSSSHTRTRWSRF